MHYNIRYTTSFMHLGGIKLLCPSLHNQIKYTYTDYLCMLHYSISHNFVSLNLIWVKSIDDSLRLNIILEVPHNTICKQKTDGVRTLNCHQERLRQQVLYPLHSNLYLTRFKFLDNSWPDNLWQGQATQFLLSNPPNPWKSNIPSPSTPN